MDVQPLTPPPTLRFADVTSECSARRRGLDALVAELAEEMAARWRQGDRPVAEEFLSRHPDLWDRPEIAARLIYEEICLRQESGDEQASVEVVQRFPQWR